MGASISKMARVAGRFVDRIGRLLGRIESRIFGRDDAARERRELDFVEPSAYGPVDVSMSTGRIGRPKVKHGRLDNIRWKGERECSYCYEALHVVYWLTSEPLLGKRHPPVHPGGRYPAFQGLVLSHALAARRPAPAVRPADGPRVHFKKEDVGKCKRWPSLYRQQCM